MSITINIVLFEATFFAATLYAAVKLIQFGGWLSILAAILLVLSYFTTNVIALLAVALNENVVKKKGDDKDEGILS